MFLVLIQATIRLAFNAVSGQQLKQHEEAAAKAKLAAGQKEVWPPVIQHFCGNTWENMGKSWDKMQELSTNETFLCGGLVVAGRGSLYPLKQWSISLHVVGIYYTTPVWR